MKDKKPSLINVAPMEDGFQRHVLEVPIQSYLYFMQIRLIILYLCVTQMT